MTPKTTETLSFSFLSLALVCRGVPNTDAVGCKTNVTPDLSPSQFYIIMNVAVGGTNGFFPDGIDPNKPWANTSPQAFVDFWNGVSALIVGLEDGGIKRHLIYLLHHYLYLFFLLVVQTLLRLELKDISF